jgi:ABC-type sugar transport system permease subunit
MATATQRPQSTLREPTMWESFSKGMRTSGIPWLFIAPALIIMLFITFYPQLYQITIAFQDFGVENLTAANPAEFVGLDNFRRVLVEGLNVPNYAFFPLLGFNIMWTLFNVLFHVLIGVSVALALNAQHVVGRRIYRVLFVIPWALPGYITGLIWNNLWQRNDGGINLLAETFNERLGTSFATTTDWLGQTDPPIDVRAAVPYIIIFGCAFAVFLLLRWVITKGLRDKSTGQIALDRGVFGIGLTVLFGVAGIGTLVGLLQVGPEVSTPVTQLFDRAGAPVLAFYAVMISNIWLGWPFMMVVATGALQSIPADLYEAADVDGATKWEQFRAITLPLLRPAMVPAIMLGTIWTFNQFNVIFFITAGGPRGQTDLLITQAYKLIQQEQQYGAAAAFSLIVFFILLIITLINNRVTQATKGYDEA